MSEGERIRLDKWLWYARQFKSRSISAQAVRGGKVRVNGAKAGRASLLIGVGDVLTIVRGKHVRLLKLIGLGTRRGPAGEAQLLYQDLNAPKTEESI